MTDEFTRIARHFAPLAGPAALGLTDDAALWTPPAGRQLVLTVDQMIEGVHFLPDDPPDLVARKLLRRNLSDLAAMGAAPTGYLLTTALRAETPEAWLAGFAEGLRLDQDRYGITLFGGDSAATRGPITTAVTMVGHVAPGEAWRRAGALPGDAIYVTGTIGDAVLGLEAARGHLGDPTSHFAHRRLLPEPRLALPLSPWLHAAIDISDGLLQDLGHLCRAAGIGATVEAAAVPCSPAAVAAGDSWLACRLTGGDDYELLFAAPAAAEPSLRAACGTVPLTRIGWFTELHSDIVVRDRQGRPIPFESTGWQHF